MEEGEAMQVAKIHTCNKNTTNYNTCKIENQNYEKIHLKERKIIKKT